MTRMDKLRYWWADVLTWQHQRWLVRRERSPWLYCLPLAVVAALLAG